MKYLALALAVTGCGALDLPNGSQFPSNPALTADDSGILSSDKGLHLLLGMGTATVTRTMANELTTWDRKEQMIAGCASAATVGIAKEFYDRDIMGTRFETLDAVYTAAGCLFTYEWVF